MSMSDHLHAYLSLHSDERVPFLIRFAWRLTVVARGYYVPQSEDLAVPAAIREINELQHRILAHALAVQMHDERRYPDDVLIAIVVDDVHEDNDLRIQVQKAFDKTVEEFRNLSATTSVS